MSKYFSERGSDLRRKPPSRRKTFQVQEMWDVHHEIARLASLGLKKTEIAKALSITAATVSYTINSPVVKDRIAILRGSRDAKTVDLAKRIQNFAPIALDLLEDVIKGNGAGKNAPIGLRSKEANNWLDRAGFGAVKKVQAQVAHLTAEDIEEIKKRAHEAGVVKSDQPIDVTPSTV